jgi:hypothetical protein
MFRRNSLQDLHDKELTGQVLDNKGVARRPLPAISTFLCWGNDDGIIFVAQGQMSQGSPVESCGKLSQLSNEFMNLKLPTRLLGG